MDALIVELGDWVMYIDSDQIEWGPWRVVSHSPKHLVVTIEDTFTMLLSKGCVRKCNIHCYRDM